jgi:transcriptional regulator
MSAKKNTETTTPETITIAEHEKGWKETKALLKRREQEKRKAELNAKLPDVLAYASKTFGKDFKTLKALVNFVAKKAGNKIGKGKRAKKLTPAEKAAVVEFSKAGKTAKEIAKEVKCTPQQVYGALKK